jgi:DNA polymerase III delta subunit
MSAKLIKAIKFSLSTTDNVNKYFLFGDEHILMYQVKNHCLKALDIKLLEKFYIDIADENFDANLDQCLMSNSLFNEKKVVFLTLSKNRLNKELVERFKKIMAYETDNILITEITNLSKKAIEKDIISKLDGDGCFIDCSSPYDSEIESYLKNNLPVFLNKNDHIKVLLEMYEANFSALFNDLEILKILEIKEEKEAMTIFTSNGDKNNYKLIEHISNNESNSALSIVNSMKKRDRNSVPLLIWILARDINAIKFIKDGKNLKTLGIWDNQIYMYKRISDRTSRESIDKSINTLDGIDKCFKGVVNGDPWNGIKDIVLELSG